jgi:gamma-glutamyltranspeptidase/glutathione hydrolase
MSSLLHAATFPHASVAADHEIASQAGVEILKAGGNAVDAAVATSFALSVVRPYSCGMGGGGFMVIRLSDKHKKGPLETAINYREQCPAAYGPDSYVKETSADASMFGGRAVAIPGSVAGLLYALEKYGTMPREKVMAPAIRAAEEGYAADAHYVECCKEIWDTFDKHPDHRTRFGFLCDRFLFGEKAKAGDIVKLREQARALRLIAAQGARGFYEGEVADAIVRAVAADGGTLTRADLSSFRVSETRPLEAVYTSPFGEYRVLTMPPPSSGGIVVAQVLDILEYRAADMMGEASKGTGKGVPLAHNSPAYIHLVTEACKHAFADRSRWLGDPAFADVPLGKLLAPTYLERCAGKVDLTKTLKPEEYGLSREAAGVPDDSGTSHFSVVDADGNAVACTETVNLVFGSRVAVPEFGFVLNDEMDDFLTRPGEVNAFGLVEDTRNLPAPGKRPLSSMTPVIALKREAAGGRGRDGQLGTNTTGPSESIALIAGASGGPRIISGTLQVALNVILFDMDAEKAVAEPRFHHQWMPDVLYLEPGLRKPDAEKPGAATEKRRVVVESRAGDSGSSHADANQLERALHGLGHKTKERAGIGTVQLIRAVPGGWDAASDPRKGGKPAGY